MDGAKIEQDKGSTENLGQPSALEKLTSGIEEGKQYTGAETKKIVQDALSAEGREQKSRAEAAMTENTRLKEELTTVTGNVTTLSTQMTELTRAQNEAAAEKVKDDPVALGSLRVQQANAAESIRLATQKAKQDANEATIATAKAVAIQEQTTASIKLAALEAGVDVDKLKELVPDGDKGRLATAAALLKGQTTIDPLTGKVKPAALTQRPASALSAGGDFAGLSADEKIQRGLDAKKK